VPAAVPSRRGLPAHAARRSRRSGGGDDLDAFLDPAVGQDHGVRTMFLAHQVHGRAHVGGDESFDFHAVVTGRRRRVAVGELGWSVVCTVRVPLGVCLLRWFESGVFSGASAGGVS
jgi:hypothetical protein